MSINGMPGMGGYGSYGGYNSAMGANINATPNWQVMDNSYMNADQKLAFIDAKYGHLFNAGLALNPSNVMPHLWNAQKLAVENYMDYKLSQMQTSQSPQGGGSMITQLLSGLLGGGGGGDILSSLMG